jgi:hypothetical protein
MKTFLSTLFVMLILSLPGVSLAQNNPCSVMNFGMVGTIYRGAVYTLSR